MYLMGTNSRPIQMGADTVPSTARCSSQKRPFVSRGNSIAPYLSCSQEVAAKNAMAHAKRVP